MKTDIHYDPDLIKAARELDAEFPGACYDGTLLKHQHRKELKKMLVKKILFHGFFYSAFTAGIHFVFRKYGGGILSSMAYGLTWFLAYILFNPRIPGKPFGALLMEQMEKNK